MEAIVSRWPVASRSAVTFEVLRRTNRPVIGSHYMKKVIGICLQVLAGAGLVSAQGAPDDGKVLTTFQNPVGNLISVPFQNNVNFPIGQFSRIQNVLNIQPVVPIHVSEDWIVISRWITPVVYQPNLGSACRSSGPIVNVSLPVQGAKLCAGRRSQRTLEI